MNKLSHILLGAILSLTLFSCNKERLEEPDNNYTNADSFYQDNKEEEQEFIIETDEGDCIVAKKGTVICGTRSKLRTPSNDTVGLPYTVKVVELYSAKDHILYQFPTAANGTALKNDGTVRIKAVQDNQNLTLTANGGFTALYSVSPVQSGNSAFKGTMSDDVFADWEIAPEGTTISTQGTKNKFSLSSFGWFQAAQNTYGTSTTTIDFELDGTGGAGLDIWLVQQGNNTILHGSDLKVEHVPVGEKFTAILIALDQDDNLVLHESTFTAKAGKTIEIDFKETDEDSILDKLNTL